MRVNRRRTGEEVTPGRHRRPRFALSPVCMSLPGRISSRKPPLDQLHKDAGTGHHPVVWPQRDSGTEPDRDPLTLDRWRRMGRGIQLARRAGTLRTSHCRGRQSRSCADTAGRGYSSIRRMRLCHGLSRVAGCAPFPARRRRRLGLPSRAPATPGFRLGARRTCCGCCCRGRPHCRTGNRSCHSRR